MNNVYQDSIPAVRTIGNVAGTLTPAALMLGPEGIPIAAAMKGTNAITNAYAMGQQKKMNTIQAAEPAPQAHIMPFQ